MRRRLELNHCGLSPSFPIGTHPPQAVPPPSKEGGLTFIGNQKAALPYLCAATFAVRPLMKTDDIRPEGPCSLDLIGPQGLSSSRLKAQGPTRSHELRHTPAAEPLEV